MLTVTVIFLIVWNVELVVYCNIAVNRPMCSGFDLHVHENCTRCVICSVKKAWETLQMNFRPRSLLAVFYDSFPCFLYSYSDEFCYFHTLSFQVYNFPRKMSGAVELIDPLSLGPFLQADHSAFSLCPCSRQHCASPRDKWQNFFITLLVSLLLLFLLFLRHTGL